MTKIQNPKSKIPDSGLSTRDSGQFSDHRPLTTDHSSNRLPRAASAILLFLVVLYRHTLGLLLGGHCRFHPSCSQYAIDAIRKHGPITGSLKTLHRLSRCHPLGPSGHDPA